MRSTNLVGLALLVVAVTTASGADGEALRTVRDQAAAIEEGAIAEPTPGWLAPPPQSGAAQAGQELGRRELLRLDELSGLPSQAQTAPAVSGEHITLLVSRSLGPEALRSIVREAAEPGVRIVFRGLSQGETLTGFLREIHALIEGIEPVPLVELDPAPFKASGADAVPLLVLSGASGEIARVAGLTTPGWLRAQVAAGRTGDLGVRGPVSAIAEPDMIEEIHRRIATLDLGAMRERSLASYWHRARFEFLPPTAQPRERLIDPTIEAKADITLPDGRSLVRRGERVNPLDHLPFTARLVVFDPTAPGQTETARALGQAAGGRPIYLATRFNREGGWEGFRAVEDALDEAVYLLTPDVRERFALEHVPATVEASGRYFLVREHPPAPERQ